MNPYNSASYSKQQTQTVSLPELNSPQSISDEQSSLNQMLMQQQTAYPNTLPISTPEVRQQFATNQEMLLKQQDYHRQQYLLGRKQIQHQTCQPIPPPATDNKKQTIEALLALNKEIIRLCVSCQEAGTNLEPNIELYEAKLQSNLSYLAAIADKKPRILPVPPPNFSPLPAPMTDIGRNIYELLTMAHQAFERESNMIMPDKMH